MARLYAGEEGVDLARELNRAQGLAPAIERLAAVATGQATRGLAFAAEPGPSGVPSIWAVALAAAWRFGLRPHVVVLGRTPTAELLPRAGRTGEAPRLLCIGGVDRLWDSQLADGFDILVSYAYSSLTPLFMDFHVRQGHTETVADAATPRPTRTTRAFSRRIEGAKARSPATWLSAECVARLPAVVDGLGVWLEPMVKSRADSRAAACRPPVGPRLPWDP